MEDQEILAKKWNYRAAEAAMWAEVDRINTEFRARMADPEKRRAPLRPRPLSDEQFDRNWHKYNKEWCE